MHRRSSAKNMALCGVLGALALVIMLAGEIVPLATFCCPVAVMFMLIPVCSECGKKLGFVWYAAVSLLCLMLTSANPEATLIFVFLGYYPMVRHYFGRIRPKLVGRVCKVLYFNASVAAAYSVLIFLFRLDEVIQEMKQSHLAITITTVVLANICFFLVERTLNGFEVYYIVHLRKRLK